jgi:hypothetical protein
MKKFALLLSMVLLSASFLLARDVSNYVKTQEGVFFFKNLRYGLNCCLIGKTSDGKLVKFKKCDVIAYCKEGVNYEKMPVYKNNKLTGEEDFMKVVCLRNGLKLYEYEYLSKKTEGLLRRYYVFRGDQFVVEMDNTNKPSLTAFFKQN